MNAYELADALEKGELIEFFEKHTQFWKVAVVKDSATMLRQQADRIAELEKIVKDTIGQAFYEDDFHKAEATIARQMQTVDSFAEENARLCKRITELEKVIKDGIKAFGDIQEKQLKNKLGICISAEEYQKTHEEFSTKAHERRGWEYAEELEQERRKQADRIAELEKDLKKYDQLAWDDLNKSKTIWCACGDGITPDSGAKCGICASTTPQTKPLSNDEIREIGDDCELKNNGILNWIEFARAIEERHGIK